MRMTSRAKQIKEKTEPMNILEKLWGLLPDKCQGKVCDRKGIRGNENTVNGKIYCDGCSLPSERSTNGKDNG